jgi:hypothetical protein
MISLVITVIVFMLLVWLLYFVAGQLGAPPKFLNIAVAVVCVLFLIWFLLQVGPMIGSSGIGHIR